MITLEIESRITIQNFRKKFAGHKEWMFSHYHRPKFLEGKRKQWMEYQYSQGRGPKAVKERHAKVYQMWRIGVSHKEIAEKVGKTTLTVGRDKWIVWNRYRHEAWRLNK